MSCNNSRNLFTPFKLNCVLLRENNSANANTYILFKRLSYFLSNHGNSLSLNNINSKSAINERKLYDVYSKDGIL